MSVNTRTTLDCDGIGCGEYLQDDISAIDMRSQARAAGWLISHVGDLCPRCRKQAAINGAQ